jgi:Ulp1 protease family, C-terminal catalytic domain/Ubiquitin carboxyl-terminal hydrolase
VRYELIGAIYHSGRSMRSGHYTSYISRKFGQRRVFVEMDDEERQFPLSGKPVEENHNNLNAQYCVSAAYVKSEDPNDNVASSGQTDTAEKGGVNLVIDLQKTPEEPTAHDVKVLDDDPAEKGGGILVIDLQNTPQEPTAHVVEVVLGTPENPQSEAKHLKGLSDTAEKKRNLVIDLRNDTPKTKRYSYSTRAANPFSPSAVAARGRGKKKGPQKGMIRSSTDRGMDNSKHGTVIFRYPFHEDARDVSTIYFEDGERLPVRGGKDGKKTEYLNDNIIDFRIMYHLLNNFKDSNTHAFSTQFYSKFKSDKYEGVKFWTRPIKNIFKKDFIYVPVNLHNHWSLMVIIRPYKVCYVSIPLLSPLNLANHYNSFVIA